MSSKTGEGAGWEEVTVRHAFMTAKAKDDLARNFPQITPDELISLVVGAVTKRMSDNSVWFIMEIEAARIVMSPQKNHDYRSGKFAITAVQERRR